VTLARARFRGSLLAALFGATAGAQPVSPQPPQMDSRLADRAHQDREIVYFLNAPETGSFSLFHDVTIREAGRSTYLNVVRAGSSVSNPSAVNLDTGEPLRVEMVRGEAIAAAKIDIGEAVRSESEVVVVRYAPVPPGHTTRLRITETYTDRARYRLEGDRLVWDRSFGRPANAVVLPAGFALEASSIPARIGLVSVDGTERLRLDFVNPRNDEISVLIHARRLAPSPPSAPPKP
jgi:hypothetical protein